MPEGVTGENANATFNNGVLEITMEVPRRELLRGRKIEIQEGARRK